jgi:pyruvate kinase
MQHSLQRTKIVCTLGPATDRAGVLEAMIRSGMDVARLNLAHGTHEEHDRRIDLVHQVSRGIGRPIGVIADLPGPKCRVGALPNESRTLHEGAIVCLAKHDVGPEDLPVRDSAFLGSVRAGESVYLADGAIRLQVKWTAPDRVACQVIDGGTVRSGSGVNVPYSNVPGSVPTAIDLSHLRFVAARSVQWLEIPFVQSPEEIREIRSQLPKDQSPLIMAKIEKRQALADLDAIMEAADGVIVARGDFEIETDLTETPVVQKRIIALANSKARPVIVGTQLLESMVEHAHPTRAEVMDVANAILDGTDAVMLSAESAIGRNPVEAVAVLQRVLCATEAEYGRLMARERLSRHSASANSAVAFAACQLSAQLEARGIIVRVRHACDVAAIAQFRPNATIVALSESEELCCALSIFAGVLPVHIGSMSAPCAHALAGQKLYAHGLARPGDHAIAVSSCDGPDNVDATADTLQVVRLPS